MHDFSNHPGVIQHYNLLQEIGVFSEVDRLKGRIGDLEELLKQASSLFSKTSVEGLLEYVIACLSDRFIPKQIIFILQDRNGKPQVYGFRNLRRSEYDVDIRSLDLFEDFFIKYTGTLHFDLFEMNFEYPDITERLRKLDPEIIVPIVGLSGLYGLILISEKIIDSPYTDEEIHYIDRLMNFTSISIQNNMHYLSAVTDAKTHLYNHVFFMKRLDEELETARSFNHNMGLIVLDIDHFKGFNDNYGHLAGDEVIKAIAGALNHGLRRGDIAARFGGEEFTILLPMATRQQTWSIAERLRKSIEDMEVRYQNQTLKVTASFGCSVLHSMNLVYSEDLLNQADSALYQSKERGRNQVSMFRPGLLVSAAMSRSCDDTPELIAPH